MRLLVFGARGQLGGDVLATAARQGHSCVGAQRSDADLADLGAASAAIERHRPDVVINCAAWTKVDAAEREVDQAYRDNALGPRLLASACHASGVLLVHVSTDFVFDGTAHSPIPEWVSPRPINVYGASKLAGEDDIRHHCPRHQIVRTSWLYGGGGPNFVLTMLRLAREQGALRVVADQTGSPTWTGHLAPALVALAELAVPGTYHLTAQGAVTWHGFAEAIIHDADLPGVVVEALTTAQYPTPAARPTYSVLDNRAWRLMGCTELPHWRVGLRRYLAELATRT